MATVRVSSDTDRARRGLPPLSRQRVSYDTKGRISGDKPSARQHKIEASHADRRTSVVPAARNSASGVRARANSGIRGFSGDEARKTPRRLNLGKFGFSPKGITNPSGYQHVLMGEMVVAFSIIGIRAIADYAPSSDEHSAGSENPTKGASPIVLIVSTLAVYFVLSFLAVRGGWSARAASAFGLLMIVALMINSQTELQQVAKWVENIGTNSTSQTAPNVTSPSLPGGGTGNSGGLRTPPSSGPGSAQQPLS
jgi:hypothetical protein